MDVGDKKMGNQCCTVEYASRRFFTKEERIAELREYQEWLTNEAKGVEEAIERLSRKE